MLVYQHFWLLVVPLLLVAAFMLSAHYPLTRAAALAFGLHYAIILTATLLYRAGPWHPLTKYPGPFPFRLSKLALAWMTSDRRQFEHLKRLHDTTATSCASMSAPVPSGVSTPRSSSHREKRDHVGATAACERTGE